MLLAHMDGEKWSMTLVLRAGKPLMRLACRSAQPDQDGV
jgi:hypothetical protein